MKTYKGFNKDLKCRGFQYEIGKKYETDEAECCKKGFHACEYPLDMFSYYSPAESRFCEVEQSGKIDKSDEDTKVASTKIKIGAEIGFKALIDASVKFILEKTKKSKASTNTGYKSASTNTGDCSASTNTGDCSASTNTGNYSASTNTGNYSKSSVSGNESVAIAVGYNSKAKASKGSAIVVCERGEWNGEDYPLIDIKSAIVDGKNRKADTWYTLKDGEFVEVDEDE